MATQLNRFDELRQACEAAGIILVLVRLPSDGSSIAAEEAKFPRARYWDALAARIPGSIHFADHEGLSGFDLVDDVHLDGPDARIFSRRLARMLRSRFESLRASQGDR